MDLKDIKNWNVEIEKEITTRWKDSDMFAFDVDTKKKIYSIDTPPPYINSPIHIGHAVTYSFMDMFARYKRMKGFEVLFPLGLDNNGLPIEMGAEKKFKVSAFDVSRETFLDYCKQLLDECGLESIDSFAKLGISFSSYKEGKSVGSIYKTDDPKYRMITQSTFIDLYKKGVVYENVRVNNWDPKLRTTIADSEIEYKDIPSTFNDIEWSIKDSNEKIVIATTRPELICSCGMVIYHPDDERYKHLEGKIAITPIFGKEILIKAHPMADPEKGTGIVMMCSAGDLSDIQFFREQRIKPIISINMDGTMNSNAGIYENLKVRAARAKIIEDLKDDGLLIKQDKIIHRTPISERSGAEIEFIEMPEFYLKQLEDKEKVRDIGEKNVNFYPEFGRKILNAWIDSVSIDWPISRRRFYATEIPIWHAENDGKKLVALPNELKYYQPWKENVPQDAQVWCDGKNDGKIVSDYNLEWKGEERVFDTWMDSSISELIMLQYKTNDEFFKKSYPASLRPQGKEIVRTWLYYTLLRGYLETGKACFDDVWIHQHILDGKGNKMSKSKGNGIDPKELIADYGAEAVRFWAAVEGDLSKTDFKCSRDRIAGEKKSLNKLLNVSKFVMMFEKPEIKPALLDIDKLFIDYLEDMTLRIDAQYAKYDFNHPAQELRFFLWDIFASNYLELVKNRAYNEEKKFNNEESASARYTLHYILERLLTLFYPIIPQITTTIAENKGIDLLRIEWPKIKKDNSKIELVEKIMAFNSDVWKKKKEAGISLRDSIEGIEVHEELKFAKKDLVACHKI